MDYSSSNSSTDNVPNLSSTEMSPDEVFAVAYSDEAMGEYWTELWKSVNTELGPMTEEIPLLSDDITLNFFNEFRNQFNLAKTEKVKFLSEGDEVNYKKLRERENQLLLRDYTTDSGELISQQRQKMVDWIVQRSIDGKFQDETMFLAVSLLDRFLSRGYFKEKRCLQIAGIASLALGVRIAETRPSRCEKCGKFYCEDNAEKYPQTRTRRPKFYKVDRTRYSRYEVLAMEWLLMDKLSFDGPLPTVHNFILFYLKAAEANTALEARARDLAKQALLHPKHPSYRPSTVAAALVIRAALENGQIESSKRVSEMHWQTTGGNLSSCREALNEMLGVQDPLKHYS